MKEIAVVLVFALGCSSGTAEAPQAPATVEHAIEESALPSVELTTRTATRLGIETTVVREGTVPRRRLVGGEVVVPPGRTIAISAPVAGRATFAPDAAIVPGARVRRGATLMRLTAVAPTDRDTRARVSREVAAAEANLVALESRVARNRTLVDERSGSARALEEATAARDVAQADLDAARARESTLARNPMLSDVAMVVTAPSNGVIRSVAVAAGQVVAAGALLVEVVDVDALQVRVPVYSGDVGELDDAAIPVLRRVGESTDIEARFVPGPPTAEPDRGTVDRYLAVDSDAVLAPGERVLVELPLRDATPLRTVPTSAMVLDAWGGAWVYRCDGLRFTRTRIDPLRRVGADTAIAHGPEVGACIVSVGAVELFGTEFPPGH